MQRHAHHGQRFSSRTTTSGGLPTQSSGGQLALVPSWNANWLRWFVWLSWTGRRITPVASIRASGTSLRDELELEIAGRATRTKVARPRIEGTQRSFMRNSNWREEGSQEFPRKR